MEPTKRPVIALNLFGQQYKMLFDLERPIHIGMLGTILLKQEPYEKETVAKVMEVLKPGNCFIDVGAHIGWFSVPAAKIVGPYGKVVVVEPDEDNMRFLNFNLKMNSINGMVATYRKAAYHETGKATFYLNLDNDGAHSLWPGSRHSLNVKTRETPMSEEIETITLDEICKRENIKTVDLVKIDTEGAEMDVLLGAENLLKAHRIKNIILEVNEFGLDQLGHNSQEIDDLLKILGYEGTMLGEAEPGMVFNVFYTRKE